MLSWFCIVLPPETGRYPMVERDDYSVYDPGTQAEKKD